jgi:hypothetical protein
VAEGVVDRLEAVEVDAQDGDARGDLAALQHPAQAVVEEHAVGQAGEGIVAGQVDDARLVGPLLGDVVADVDHILRRAVGVADQHLADRQQVGRAVGAVEADLLRARRVVAGDQLAVLGREGVGLGGPEHVGVGLADHLVPRQAEGLLAGLVEHQEAARGGLDDEQYGRHALDHRVEEAARALRLGHGLIGASQSRLQLGDIDPQADGAAIRGAALLDHDPAAVGQPLLVAHARIGQQRQPLSQPFLLAADGLWVVAPRHPDAQGLLQLAAHLEEVGAAGIDVGVGLVPEDVAPLGVEEDDALRQGVDRPAKTLLRLARAGLGRLERAGLRRRHRRHSGRPLGYAGDGAARRFKER